MGWTVAWRLFLPRRPSHTTSDGTVGSCQWTRPRVPQGDRSRGGGGVAGDDGDGHGCSFRCGAGLLPGGRCSGRESWGRGCSSRSRCIGRRGCGVRVPRRGCARPGGRCSGRVERVGAGLGDGDRDRGLDAEQQRRGTTAGAAEQHRPGAGLRAGVGGGRYVRASCWSGVLRPAGSRAAVTVRGGQSRSRSTSSRGRSRTVPAGWPGVMPPGECSASRSARLV